MTQRQRFMAEAAVAALAGVVLAVTGAFGTGDMPLAARFLYWIGGLLAAGLALQALLWATRPLAELLNLPDYAPHLFAVPLLAVIIFLALDVFADASGALSLILYMQILGLGLGFFILFAALYWRSEKGQTDTLPKSAEAGAEAAATPSSCEPRGIANTRLHERLRPGFGPITALGVEDHYVKAFAQGNTDMVLMNLADAIALMPKDSGVQVHRSWWVALAAVVNAERSGRNLRLQLVCGTCVPVSRANHRLVREAGLLH